MALRNVRDGEIELLRNRVALHDVADVEAFVNATLDRFERQIEHTLVGSEREELTSEGLAIMYELAAVYRPRLEGYDADGRFSGYAARYLPRRLGDAWHRLHPEHRYVTDPSTGKRRWLYLTPPVSLDSERDAPQKGLDGKDNFDLSILRPDSWVQSAPRATAA